MLELVDDWGPEKVVMVSDRRTGMKGVLVIDNTALGRGKGGTRMSPTVTVREIARLARTMTWKWAASGLFHGGAKAGIVGDPAGADKELLLRAFARALSNEAPAEYVFGLDMGLTENDAAILADELGGRHGAVGLPTSLGGLPYDELGITGFGVAEAALAAAEVIGLDLTGARVAIQGFGAVGAAVAGRLAELGVAVASVATARGTLVADGGLDVPRLLALKAVHGDELVAHYDGPRTRRLPDPASVLEVSADVLVAAAREDVVDVEVAEQTSARLVIEGANLPSSLAARSVLHDRGVTVVPDFIANAGGIVAAAYSMNARDSAFAVRPDEVFTTVSTTIRGNVARVLEESRRGATAPHEAAMRLAQERVARGMRARGRLH